MSRSYTDLNSTSQSTTFDGPASYNTYHRNAYHYQSAANQTDSIFNFQYPASSRQRPLATISTSVDRVYDDDQTPVAGHRDSSPSFARLRGNQQTRPAKPHTALKYECGYCGKGFNRPSSLKVTLFVFLIVVPQQLSDTYQQPHGRET